MRLLSLLLGFCMTVSLSAATYNIEVGAFQPTFDGTIENPDSLTDYSKDLNYEATLISYFGFEADFDSWYLPTFKINYFNMSDSYNANLTGTKQFVGYDYNGSVTTWTDYSVINVILSKDFHRPGTYFNAFGRQLYTGDLYFDIGVNLKNIDYRFEVRQNGITDPENDFISVKSNILMPYIGLKYRIGYLTIYGDVSTLALGDVKANSFKGALEYRIYKNIAINGGYMYEDFEATEKLDKVNFKAGGGFGSIKLYF